MEHPGTTYLGNLVAHFGKSEDAEDESSSEVVLPACKSCLRLLD
jgi:hypothetical protein